MNLNFKVSLMLIANSPLDNFTSREFSDYMIKLLFDITEYVPQLRSNPAAGEYILRFRPKLISNDLRRLYIMGFLKRKKVKRLCKTKTGKTGFKGYEYRYSLSTQGRKYLAWMMSEEGDFEIKNFIDFFVLSHIKKEFPEEKQDLAWEIYKVDIRDKKGYKRFSTSRNALHLKIIDHMWEVKRGSDKKIKELEEENKKLNKKIKAMEEENEDLKKMIILLKSSLFNPGK